jgi:hypothetical protein
VRVNAQERAAESLVVTGGLLSKLRCMAQCEWWFKSISPDRICEE